MDGEVGRQDARSPRTAAVAEAHRGEVRIGCRELGKGGLNASYEGHQKFDKGYLKEDITYNEVAFRGRCEGAETDGGHLKGSTTLTGAPMVAGAAMCRARLGGANTLWARKDLSGTKGAPLGRSRALGDFGRQADRER